MDILLAILGKELLLLRRDRTGLALLFLMPAVLVLVISLVQENVLRASSQIQLGVVLVDGDGQGFGRRLSDALMDSGLLHLTRWEENDGAFKRAAEAAIRGEFQAAILVPAGTGAALSARAQQEARQAMMPAARPPMPATMPAIDVQFDPRVTAAARAALLNALQRLLFAMEMQERFTALSALLSRQAAANVAPLPGLPATTPVSVPRLEFPMEPALQAVERSPLPAAGLPSSAQQNVPAWALFGMFFVVVPMAGGLVRERQEAILARLMTLPVSPLQLLAGRVAAWMLVCLLQLVLMAAIGRFVLPLLGGSRLELGGAAPLTLAAMASSAALAAAGYGILVGSLARTYEQAASFGAISVVVAAALGGIMVPAFAMPPAMQRLSALSPLNWGLEGFLDLLVRSGNLSAILPNAAALILFGILCLGAGAAVLRQRGPAAA